MKEETKVVSLRIPPRLLLEADRIAEKRKMTQAEVLRMCLDLGLECHKDMENLGLIGAVDLIYYVRQSIRKSAKGVQLPLPM